MNPIILHMRKVHQFAHAHNNAELTEPHLLLEGSPWMLLNADSLLFTVDIETLNEL